MNPYLTLNQGYGKARSLILVTVAYCVAILAGCMTYYWTSQLSPLWAALIILSAATVVIWAAGVQYNNSSFYDPFWSIAPPLIALCWRYIYATPFDLREILLLLVIVSWSVRLTSNWARDWPGLEHEDWRYQEMRANNPNMYPILNLFGICLFPTFLVFMGMLPVLPLYTENTSAFSVLDIVAAILGFSAVIIQFVADEQMRRFRRSEDGKTGFLNTGLWAWSRHPNYFGEVLFWFSLWLFALSGVGVAAAWTGIGWVAMLALFLFISCPWMDRRSAVKRPGYAEYMQHSTLLFLWPPRKR